MEVFIFPTLAIIVFIWIIIDSIAFDIDIEANDGEYFGKDFR